MKSFLGAPVPVVAMMVVALAGVSSPLLVRLLKERAGYALAGVLAAAAALIASATGPILTDGPLVTKSDWLPDLGINFVFVLDGLSLIFSMIVLVIGAAVLSYSVRYFGPRSTSTTRTYTLLLLFASSMLGLVLSGDLILLFVFWELTSVLSFFLIAGAGPQAERAATRALLVTGLGGLALLGGIVLLGIEAGTYEIAEIGRHANLAGAGLLAMWLVFIGAATKSAQVPFHFWLPGAMAAPTPVSTYLHAATMVKAGVYLIARLSPVFEGSSFRAVIVFVGLATSLFGAAAALKQYDLKAVLAYSTVSQLGLLMALVGVGTPQAIAAAVLQTVAHASYKASLFMVVGVIDREAGSRNLRDLSGLRRSMPITAAVTGVAGLSMAGIPPLIGFVSKEEAYTAFLGAGSDLFRYAAVVLAVAASALTFAYGARIWHGAFLGEPKQRLYEPRLSFIFPAVLTSAAAIVLVPLLKSFDPLLEAISGEAFGHGAPHLALWHGFTAALGLSALTILLGVGAFVFRTQIAGALRSIRLPRATDLFDKSETALFELGRRSGDPLLVPVPARHLSLVLVSVLVTGLVAARRLVLPVGETPPSLIGDWVVTALLAGACLGISRARNRLAAAALAGVIGFLVAVVYVLFGAPDLVLTQLLIETLTVALLVFVFRYLPADFSILPQNRSRLAAGIAGASAVSAGLAAYVLTGRRGISEAGRYHLENASSAAGGKNAVNTILVDFRALDTLGEITVLAVAAAGLALVVRATPKRDNR